MEEYMLNSSYPLTGTFTLIGICVSYDLLQAIFLFGRFSLYYPQLKKKIQERT